MLKLYSLDHLPETNMKDSDGRHVVAVALKGKHGDGDAMVLDVMDWRRVALGFGRDWFVARDSRGERHVVGYAGGTQFRLARHLVAARRGDRIGHLNEDFRDLRRCNLKVTRASHQPTAEHGHGSRSASRGGHCHVLRHTATGDGLHGPQRGSLSHLAARPAAAPTGHGVPQ